jgi:hypothetical protein
MRSADKTPSERRLRCQKIPRVLQEQRKPATPDADFAKMPGIKHRENKVSSQYA